MSSDTCATGLYTFNTADWAMDFSFMVQMQNPGEPYAGTVPCYLIEHPEGTVLFDTGVSYEMQDDPESYGPSGAPHMAEFTQTLEMDESQRLPKMLETAGYGVGDVDYVVLSHLHTDHAGNVTEFTDAEIIVNEDELRYAWWPTATAQGFFYLGGDFLGLRGPEYDVRTISGGLDLFGDGSVEIVPTPGHSPGHQSLKVELEESGTVILGADVANHQEGLAAGMAASFNWSLDDSAESMERIRRLADQEDADVYLTHDQEDTGALPEAPDKLE